MATLKISELSVDDWVRYDNGVTPYSIRSIERTGDQECVVLKDDMYPDGITGFVKYLKPIPITAEILEKNGFVKSDDFLYKIDLPDNILLGVRRQTDGYIFELKREKRRLGELLVIIRGISYIHDLQHALRLAGIDKEINFKLT